MNTVKSKKVKLLLLFVIIFAFFSRFFFLDKIPPLVNSAISQRYFLASLSVGSVILLYLLVYHAFKSARIALLSAMIFCILPWTVEQGRIVSSVNIALFFLLGTILLAKKIKITALKWIIYLSVPLILYLAYPQFWLFRSKDFIPSLSKLTNDMFILVSPDFFFFKNPTFWWGGVRETGILYLSFLPFLLVGFYELILHRRYKIFLWMLLILFISSASPFFPESREFFLITPFLSLTVALGINNLFKPIILKNILLRLIGVALFILVVYEVAQFFHYYMIHYPQQINSNISNIHEPF